MKISNALQIHCHLTRFSLTIVTQIVHNQTSNVHKQTSDVHRKKITQYRLGQIMKAGEMKT